jgi:DNA invertase Pin-like site-specific DNA recombinase
MKDYINVRNVLRVALYVRKSRADIEAERKAKERGEIYDTLQRHRNQLLRLAKQRGYEIVEIYEEVVSGDTIEARPEMQRLLKDVQDFKFDAIMVVEYDRLGRGDKQDQGKIEEILADTDTIIITPDDIIDLNTEEGQFKADTKGFISRMEYRVIKKRLKEGKKRSISEGKDISNKQPYGYSKDRDTKKLYPNDYAPFAKLIFELYDEIGTLHGVCEELYRIGIPTKEGKDRWDYQTLKRMLKNKKYIGTMFYNANKVRDYVEQPNAHTAIVDEELFNRVNYKLKNVKDHKTNKIYELKNPFASLGRCGICGSLTKLHNLKYKYIRCSNYHCNNKFIRFEEYEEKLLLQLEEILKSIEIDPKEVQQKDNKLTTLNQQLKLLYDNEEKFKKRNDNIHILLEDGTYTKETFKMRLDELNKERNENTHNINTLLELIEYEKTQLERITGLAPNIKNVLDIYKLSTPEQQNRLLKSFIKSITTHKPKKFKDFEMHIKLLD